MTEAELKAMSPAQLRRYWENWRLVDWRVRYSKAIEHGQEDAIKEPVIEPSYPKDWQKELVSVKSHLAYLQNKIMELRVEKKQKTQSKYD